MAKDWNSTAEIAVDSEVYGAFILVLAGISIWDVLSTIDFDLSIILRKRPFRWPMILYFVCRVCLLLHIFPMAVNLNAIHEIRCQEVTWVSKVADAVGTCCSSLILILRTRAVWNRDIKITALLGVLFLGQIAVWCQTFRYSRSEWSATRNACAVLATAPKPLLVAVFAYTMVFDLIILLLCAAKLRSGHAYNSFGSLLLRDGIGYFCAAFGANLVQTVLAACGFNPVMNIMALPFALVVSAIASTTVFRRVFVAYDAFTSQPGHSGVSRSFSMPRFNVHATPRHDVDSIALGTFAKSANSSTIGAIEVHRVVDVNVDGLPNTKATRQSESEYAMDGTLPDREKGSGVL